MLLILTHEKADFDAVAAQMAAYKLYPEGKALLSRQMNHNVEQFLTLYWDAFAFERAENWQRRRVDRVLLVDTQTVNSVRGMMRKPQVTVIDHHVGHKPPPEWLCQVEAVGATTTLLVERLQASGLALSAEEATLLLLGIYEDTGALTYDLTTARDAYAAGWLLEQGAQLGVARRFLQMPLTGSQQALYNDLLSAVEWHEINGQSLVVTTAVVPASFSDEISAIAHRLRETLTAAGLFVLVQLGADVQLVARSSRDEINVAVVAKALGGGGHTRAAAAILVKQSLTAVHQQLLNLLPQAVQPQARVGQIMSLRVQTLPASTTAQEAAERMRRFGYEGYPVVEPDAHQGKGRLVGLLSRREVDRAVNHGLGAMPVRQIMQAGSVTIRPSDSIDHLQKLMLTEGWGQIPVVADDAPADASAELMGVVTRTDLLNFIFQSQADVGQPKMRGLLQTALSPALWAMTTAVSQEAASLATPLYFVGGLVRDLLLGKPSADLDMVVESDGIRLVRQLQERWGGNVHTHRRFGTAKWFLSTAVWQKIAPHADLNDVPQTIDFVTARTEFYTEPSALPEIENASIKLDLHRRDFTMNTLAIRLDGAHLGQLLDFYGGRRDLEARVVRVLHSLSFIDDPTRILRAVRFEQRLGFQIEPRTAELLQTSLPILNQVTGDRIRHEIEWLLREADPTAMIVRLTELGVLPYIQPQLTWPLEAAAAFARVPALLADPLWRATLEGETPVFIYFALWLLRLPAEVREAVMQRLRVQRRTRDDMAAVLALLALLEILPATARPGHVERALRPFKGRVLLVGRTAVGVGPQAAQIEQYMRVWRLVKTAVSGDDLRAMGLKPGPQYAVLLEQLLAARLDGQVHSEAEERELLATWLEDGES